MIKNLKEYTPLLSIAIILGSAINLNTYYSAFNISITNYMNLGEFIVSFLGDQLVYIAIFASGLMWSIVDDIFQNTSKSSENSEDLNKKRRRFYRLLLWILLAIHILIIIAKIWFLSYYIFSTAIIITILFYFFLIFYSMSVDKLSKYISLIPTILFLSYLHAGYKISEIKEDHKQKKSLSITVDQKKIETNSNLIYLGKTNDYLFLYDKEEDRSIIYPTKEIEKTEIF